MIPLTFDFTISVSVLVTLGLAVLALVRTRRQAVDDRFSAVREEIDLRLREGSKRMDRHDNRLTAIETDLKSMPAKDDLYEVKLEISGMVGEIKEMRALMDGNAGLMKRIEAMIVRHEDHLLGGSK